MATATATPRLVPGSIEDDRQKLAAVRTARFTEAVETLRRYAERKAAGETCEPEDIEEADLAFERLKFDRGRLPALIEALQTVTTQGHILDNADEREAELREQVEAAFQIREAKQAELAAAKSAHAIAVHAERLFYAQCNEVLRIRRDNPILFGTVEQALAVLLPEPLSPEEAARKNYPNEIIPPKVRTI